jgi:hypothetical protein
MYMKWLYYNVYVDFNANIGLVGKKVVSLSRKGIYHHICNSILRYLLLYVLHIFLNSHANKYHIYTC